MSTQLWRVRSSWGLDVPVDDSPFRWVVRLAAHLAGELVRASSPGTPRWDWFYAGVEPGDLVVEMSTHGWPQGACGGLDHFIRLGRYLARDVEMVGDGDDAVTEPVDVIVLADGTVATWRNCRFARVPEETLRDLLEGVDASARRIPLREGGFLPIPRYLADDRWPKVGG